MAAQDKRGDAGSDSGGREEARWWKNVIFVENSLKNDI